ncbi:hypothetical protein [Lapidilactobacillus wuchangensis]|uniref:hypothetical protein n=1 Tax=Lapidilactobacillus wuchangensis TaxID=2486001 RepID=UPI000F76DB74|nr:hypothetical protein [Lapidilactobacillus wuchangensis]
MLKGKTKSGFVYQIADARLQNYELVEKISAYEDNPLELPKVVNLLLGEEQTKKLKDHLRTKDGLVPVDAIGKEIAEIFQEQAKLKKS